MLAHLTLTISNDVYLFFNNRYLLGTLLEQNTKEYQICISSQISNDIYFIYVGSFYKDVELLMRPI
jgi:hypothetical protein